MTSHYNSISPHSCGCPPSFSHCSDLNLFSDAYKVKRTDREPHEDIIQSYNTGQKYREIELTRELVVNLCSVSFSACYSDI